MAMIELGHESPQNIEPVLAVELGKKFKPFEDLVLKPFTGKAFNGEKSRVIYSRTVRWDPNIPTATLALDGPHNPMLLQHSITVPLGAIEFESNLIIGSSSEYSTTTTKGPVIPTTRATIRSTEEFNKLRDFTIVYDLGDQQYSQNLGGASWQYNAPQYLDRDGEVNLRDYLVQNYPSGKYTNYSFALLPYDQEVLREITGRVLPVSKD